MSSYEALEAENRRLSERVEQLEALLGMDIEPAQWLGLTAAEARVFGYLLQRGSASKGQIHTALYAYRAGDHPELKIVDVFVCKLRRKLKPAGIEIATMWGTGYAIDAENRARAQALISKRLAA